MANPIRRMKELGFWGTLVMIARRIPGVRALSVYYFYSLDADDLAAAEAASRDIADDSLRIVPGNALIDDMVAVQDKRGIFEQRVARGHHGLMAYVNDSPAAYCWSQADGAHLEELLGFEINAGPEAMYVYDIYVVRDFRKHGLARHIAYANLRHAVRVLGKRETIAVIEINNLRSRRANERVGWKKTDLWIYLEAWGRTWHRRIY